MSETTPETEQSYSVPPSQQNVRAWAKENGYEVAETGRIKNEVKQAFKDAHPA